LHLSTEHLGGDSRKGGEKMATVRMCGGEDGKRDFTLIYLLWGGERSSMKEKKLWKVSATHTAAAEEGPRKKNSKHAASCSNCEEEQRRRKRRWKKPTLLLIYLASTRQGESRNVLIFLKGKGGTSPRPARKRRREFN